MNLLNLTSKIRSQGRQQIIQASISMVHPTLLRMLSLCLLLSCFLMFSLPAQAANFGKLETPQPNTIGTHQLAFAEEEVIYPKSFLRTSALPGMDFSGGPEGVTQEYNRINRERFNRCTRIVVTREFGTCYNWQSQHIEPEGRIINELPMSYISRNLYTMWTLNFDGTTYTEQRFDVNNVRISRFLECVEGTILQIERSPTGDTAYCKIL